MADIPLSNLTELTSLSDTDLIPVSEDVGGGSFTSRYMTALNFLTPSRIQSVKTSNTQDINSGTPVSITFDANEFTSNDVSHTSGSANFTINTTGTYEVSFNINGDGGNTRSSPKVSVFVDGVEELATIGRAYMRNNADGNNTCSCPPYELPLTATSVVTIRGESGGSTNTVNTILNQCWVRIKRIS